MRDGLYRSHRKGKHFAYTMNESKYDFSSSYGGVSSVIIPL